MYHHVMVNAESMKDVIDPTNIERYVKNRFFDKTTIFHTGNNNLYEVVENHFPDVSQIVIEDGLSYTDIFSYLNKRSRGEVCVIANYGVEYDESLAIISEVELARTVLFVSDARKEKRIVCKDTISDVRKNGTRWIIIMKPPIINVLSGMNIYQEGSLGMLYKAFVNAGYVTRDISEYVKTRNTLQSTKGNEWNIVNYKIPSVSAINKDYKVFGIGFQRTGTSSLRRALNIVGITTLEKYGNWYLTKIHDGLEFDPSINYMFFRGFADSPIPLYYKELHSMFPDAKFVLTIRNTERWLRSVEKLFETKSLWSGTVDSDKINAFHRRVYGMSSFEERRFKKVYERHNQEVLKYFSTNPDQLLVLNIEKDDKWDKLCNFLEVEIPPQKYPHVNKSGNQYRWKFFGRKH